jgi:hypothetical protein
MTVPVGAHVRRKKPTRPARLAFYLAACLRARLPIPSEVIAEALALPVPPDGGYVPPVAGGSFEHTSMIDCPTHLEQVQHWREYVPYKGTNASVFICVRCTLESYLGEK